MFLPLLYPIWAPLGTRYEFLTMRKVISGRKRYGNTNNLEKSDFFVENFFLDLWPKTEKEEKLVLEAFLAFLLNFAYIKMSKKIFYEKITFF